MAYDHLNNINIQCNCTSNYQGILLQYSSSDYLINSKKVECNDTLQMEFQNTSMAYVIVFVQNDDGLLDFNSYFEAGITQCTLQFPTSKHKTKGGKCKIHIYLFHARYLQDVIFR